MPNSFAYVALFSWPLVVIFLFRVLPQAQAVVWSVIGGYLALPYAVGIDPPILPAFDKTLIPALSAAVMLALGGGLPERRAALPRRGLPERRGGLPERHAALPRRGLPPAAVPDATFSATANEAANGAANNPAPARRGAAFTRQTLRRAPQTEMSAEMSAEVPEIAPEATPPAAAMAEALIRPGPIPRSVVLLLAGLILTQFITFAGNRDPYIIAGRFLPGLTLYDAFSMVLDSLVMVLPFVLGLVCLGAPARQVMLLRAFCLAGVIYALPTLFEIRFSPQLSTWTYGFLAQSFAMAMRDGGFRPVVFLQQGIWLAIFLAMAAMAALALWRQDRAEGRAGGRALAAGIGLSLVLGLCHSLGALVILVLLAPIVVLGSLRVQMVLALCITLAILTYPLLRGAGLVPVQSIGAMAASISAEREQSLQYRFDNEDQLLAHANQRPLAGWGGYGRPRVYDPETGNDLSITDGIWIIVMGGSGWLGYLATFGLLGMPVVVLFWRRRRLGLSLATAGLCLMLAANLIDMIPNATLTPLTWLLAGALAGRCRFAAGTAGAGLPAAPAPRAARQSRTALAQARPLRRLSGVLPGGALAVIMATVLAVGPAQADLAASAVPVGLGLTNPTLAFGLSGTADYSTNMPFLDLMKTARAWIGHKKDAWGGMTYQELLDGGYLDAEGWPKAIPPGQASVGTIWAWNKEDRLAAASRAGVYVLTYQGEGKLEFGGNAQVLRNRPGKILFRVPQQDGFWLNITATDPHQTGDYLRDIVIVPQRYEALLAAGEIFNPDWLKVVEDARVLRFMDWMGTNGTIGATWEARPRPQDATWVRHGVPLEVMVQLANQTGTEPWFTMPAGADEAYIRAFATYVRDHLNPALPVHVEYSNETWNWGFQQTHWMLEQAKAVWPTEDQAAYLDYNAMVSTKSALIWDAVFGMQAKTRLDKVLAVQTVNTWATEHLLKAPLWQKFDPAGFVAPASVFNSLAVTTYFGGATMADAKLRDAFMAVLKDPGLNATDWLKARLEDPDYPQSIPQIVTWWQGNRAIADTYGLHLVAYEGGQHLLQSFGIAGMSEADQALLTGFLSGFVRGPAMAGLYRQLWTDWAAISDGPFMQFTDVGAPSKWGAWGLLSALGDHNPRADLLFDLNARSKAWFGTGGGPQYQQGVIRLAGDGGEALMGTDRDDFLIGGAGDDSFTPGRGHDAISGGAGVNRVLLPGVPEDYHLAAANIGEGASYHLTGPETDDILRDIDSFEFTGGISKTLDQMLAP